MLLLFLIRVAEIPLVLEKGCTFCLLCMSFVNVLFMRPSFNFGFESGMWYLIIFIPDHCLSLTLKCQGLTLPGTTA